MLPRVAFGFVSVLVSAVAAVAAMQFPLPSGMEAFFKYLMAPFGACVGFGLGCLVWKDTNLSLGKTSAWLSLALVVLIFSGSGYRHFYFTIPSPSIVVQSIESGLFVTATAAFYFALAFAVIYGGSHLWTAFAPRQSTGAKPDEPEG